MIEPAILASLLHWGATSNTEKIFLATEVDIKESGMLWAKVQGIFEAWSPFPS